MNIYYLEIIGASKNAERKIEADDLSWSEAGLYVFTRLNENGLPERFGFYPVDRTIIKNVEYNINE